MARQSTVELAKKLLTPKQFAAWKRMSPRLSAKQLLAGHRPGGRRVKAKPDPRKGKRASAKPAARKGKRKSASKKLSASKKRSLEAQLARDWERQEQYQPADFWSRGVYSNPRKGRRVRPESIRRVARQQLGKANAHMHGPSDERAIQKLVAQGHTIKDAVRLHYIGNPARRRVSKRRSTKRRSYKRNCGLPPRDSKGRFKKARRRRR